MNPTESLPEPIERALASGPSFLRYRDQEWKVEVEGRDALIERYTGRPVCVFANNGYGDQLFLMEDEEGAGLAHQAYEFFHEGHEIIALEHDLSPRRVGLLFDAAFVEGHVALVELGR